MRILLTGGAGYLGSIFAELALAKGHTVTVVDDFSRSKTSLLHLVRSRSLKIVRGDARDEKLLRACVPEHDLIIPLAGVVGQAACDADPSRAAEVNRGAIVTLLAARKKHGLPREQRIAFPATNSGYGTTSGQVACDETTPLEPISHYGRTKVEAEDRVLDAENTVSLRFATLFGPSPAMRWDLLVNYFVREAFDRRYLVLFEGHYKRNYLHVQDAARALLELGVLDKLPHTVFNVGLPDAKSKRELAGMVSERTACYVHEAPVGADPDQRNYEVSVERLLATGWKPSWSLADGIDQLTRAAVGALS